MTKQQQDARSPEQVGGEGHPCLVSRRQFLLTAGAATATFTVMVTMNPGTPQAQKVPAAVATYPRKLIGKLSELQIDQPLDFTYPDDEVYSESMLVKLGREAGGGIGPQRDVVAFNYTCTHQGGPLQGTYKPGDKALGPCPLHLSTYDLTRHGITISGNAYQSLPQVLLELEGDDIYAVGIFGLIFGRYDNLQA
ncbi:MAG: arsenate reductase (azurin) small subunit [Kiloniellales bacterium]|nr:arsenate reductase (azurin) small subunit [Kiloniellales bacterium]